MLKLKIIFLLIGFIITPSCSNNKNFSKNAEFEKKFKKDVNKINKERKLKENKVKSSFNNLNPNDINNLLTPELQNDQMNDSSNSFPYVDIAIIGDNPQKQIFPNYESYERNIFNNPAQSLPPKIFEISYNTFLNPPFNQIGIEFDFIDIPNTDKFGISSSHNNKNYTLVPIQSLQTAVKAINDNRSDEDIEFSKKIIAEKKTFFRKKDLEHYQEKNEYNNFVANSKK